MLGPPLQAEPDGGEGDDARQHYDFHGADGGANALSRGLGPFGRKQGAIEGGQDGLRLVDADLRRARAGFPLRSCDRSSRFCWSIGIADR